MGSPIHAKRGQKKKNRNRFTDSSPNFIYVDENANQQPTTFNRFGSIRDLNVFNGLAIPFSLSRFFYVPQSDDGMQ